MTRRERMERRAEQRALWADGAEKAAASRFRAADRAVEGIPFGQPILVGHHSERRHRNAIERCDSNMRAGIERSDMAKRHASIAETLQERLETVIFSDDDNALAELEARIAGREAERARIKAYNVSCRKGNPDVSLLDDAERANLEVIKRVCPYQLGKGGSYPAYALSNLGGNIKADRDRILTIQRAAKFRAKAEAAGGVLISNREGYCNVTFSEKPDREVINALKAAGFGWCGGSGCWGGYFERMPQIVLDLEAEAVKP